MLWESMCPEPIGSGFDELGPQATASTAGSHSAQQALIERSMFCLRSRPSAS
jgi:hypothetical protein